MPMGTPRTVAMKQLAAIIVIGRGTSKSYFYLETIFDRFLLAIFKTALEYTSLVQVH